MATLLRALACGFLVVAGCAPADDDSPAPATTTSTTGETTSSPAAAEPQVFASFVAEEAAGDAPALLRMINETPDQVLSLTLDDGQEYTFYLIDPLATSDYAITASDDLWADAILSIHTNDTCVRKPFAEMTGPLSLAPGHAYSIRVSIDGGFTAHIEEDAMPEPYVGVRAHVADPAGSSTPSPSRLVLATAGGAPSEIVYETIFTEYPEPYVRVAGSAIEIASVRFVDRAQVTHEAAGPFVLEGSHGYTVYVDDVARDDAVFVAPLQAVE